MSVHFFRFFPGVRILIFAISSCISFRIFCYFCPYICTYFKSHFCWVCNFGSIVVFSPHIVDIIYCLWFIIHLVLITCCTWQFPHLLFLCPNMFLVFFSWLWFIACLLMCLSNFVMRSYLLLICGSPNVGRLFFKGRLE